MAGSGCCCATGNPRRCSLAIGGQLGQNLVMGQAAAVAGKHAAQALRRRLNGADCLTDPRSYDIPPRLQG